MPKWMAFGKPLDQPGNGDLVAHLGELARAGRAEQLAHARIMRDQRLGLVIVGLHRRRT